MLAVGCDHGGFALKTYLLSCLSDKGIEYVDVGCYDEKSVDYPDIASVVVERVLSGACERGLLICGTGIGISIAANRHEGIRCALCSDPYSARMTRAHNDANILAMGGRVVGPGLAEEILDQFLNTPFDGGRHALRIAKLDKARDGEKTPQGGNC